MAQPAAPGDGRLDLDDLGSVIERASSLDAPQDRGGEVVAGGAESPSWAERLEVLGLTPWLRRHRLAIAACVTVIVVAAVAGTAYLRDRPVPDDGVVALQVLDAVVDQNAGSALTFDSGNLTFPYNVTPTRSGDSITVLGLIGPGIRASSAHPPVDPASGTDTQPSDGSPTPVPNESTTPEAPGAVNVMVVPDCDDPRLFTATDDMYSLDVQRTDALGRVARSEVPVPGATAARWAGSLVSTCAPRWVADHLRTTQVRVRPEPATTAVAITLTIASGLPVPVTLNSFSGTRGRVSTQVVDAVVAPGTTSDIGVPLRLLSCTAPLPDPTRLDTFGQSPLVLQSSLSTTSSTEGGAYSAYLPTLDATARRELRDAIVAACVGAPSFRAQVVAAGPARDRALLESAAVIGMNAPAVVGIRLAVTTAADQIVAHDTVTASDEATGQPHYLATSAAAVRSSRATVDLHWLLSCTDQSNPPQVVFDLRRGARTYPETMQLDSLTVARAYLRACPSLSVTDLSNFAWPNLPDPAGGDTGGSSPGPGVTAG